MFRYGYGYPIPLVSLGALLKQTYPIPDIQTTFIFQSVQPATINQVAITLKADVGAGIKLNFGAGGADIDLLANGHDETYTSIYSTINTTYDITLTGDLFALRKFLILNENTITLYTDNFKLNNVGLSVLDLDTVSGNITGTLSNLPPSLASLRLDTVGSLITGSISDLPTGLTLLEITGNTEITGNLQSLPQYIINLRLNNCPLISGNIENFNDDARIIDLSNLATTITGSIDNLPKKRIDTLILENLGSLITGNIDTLDNTEKVYYGGIKNLNISATISTNSFVGSLNNVFTNNSALTNFVIVNLGDNITGDISNLPSTFIAGRSVKITGCGSAITFTDSAWNVEHYVNVILHCGFTSTEIDNLLIRIAAKSGVAGANEIIDLSGNNDGITNLVNSSVNSAIITINEKFHKLYLNDPDSVTNFDIDLGLTATASEAVITLNNDKRFTRVGIDWGDGVIDYLSNYGTHVFRHTYTITGVKAVKLKNAYGLNYFASSFNLLTGLLTQFESCNYLYHFRTNVVSNMTGSLNSVAKSALQYLSVYGNIGSSVTLSLDTLGANSPNLTYLYIAFMTVGRVTGKLSALPSAMTALTLYDLGSQIDIETGTMPSWAGLAATLHCNHASASVDNFLISWAATAGAGAKIWNIQRVRTSASDAAVATLNALGKTINTSNV